MKRIAGAKEAAYLAEVRFGHLKFPKLFIAFDIYSKQTVTRWNNGTVNELIFQRNC